MTARNVSTVPFVEERMKPILFSGEKKQQRTLAEGWIISDWLAIADDGRPWHVSRPSQVYTELAKSAPWYLQGMRQQILAGEPVKLAHGYTLRFPQISWHEHTGSFYGDANKPVQIDTNDYDSTLIDAEHVLTHTVVELASPQAR